MNDMNFFSTFLDKKTRKQSKQAWIIFVLLALVVLGATGYFIIDMQSNATKTDITAMKNTISDLNKQAANEQLKMQLLGDYRKYGAYIDKIDAEAKKQETLTSDSFTAIGKCIPDGACLLTCNIMEGQADLVGKAPTNISVGIFCKNLQESNLFSDIAIVSTAVDDSGSYDFDISCTVEGGAVK